MRMNQPLCRTLFHHGVLVGCVLATMFLVTAWAQSTEKVLYTFTGRGDGAIPVGGLLLDQAGNVYGTASSGGSPACIYYLNVVGCGVAFELSPTSNGGWTEKILYNFQGGLDGAFPASDLIPDKQGNLYGTTSGGGGVGCNGLGCGTAFRLTRHPGGQWTETVLHRFQGGTDGAYPNGLTFDHFGNLYGTTYSGGVPGPNCDTQFHPGGCGIVFELSPSANGWRENILHVFSGSDGAGPIAKLIYDGSANFYASATGGGPGCCGGFGVFFELSPNAHGTWSETVLYSFEENPLLGVDDGVIADRTGKFYGTTFNGYNSWGTVFELHHNPVWNSSVLYSFGGLNANGLAPQTPPTMDRDGNLYGTTWETANNPTCNCGTVYKLTPNSDASWTESDLYNFMGGSDGEDPFSTVTLDASGHVYGTTLAGGTGQCVTANGLGCGVVYEITQ
jgi:hypothetical protein